MTEPKEILAAFVRAISDSCKAAEDYPADEPVIDMKQVNEIFEEFKQHLDEEETQLVVEYVAI
jgi:hypothetical protein